MKTTKQTEEQLKKKPAPKRQGWGRFPLYGDVAKVTCKEDGVVNSISIYYFNANGDVAACKGYNSSGELNWIYTYRYDSAGNVIESVGDNSSGELDWRVTYRYDSAGNLIEMLEYGSSGKLYGRKTYRYDSAGNLIEEVHDHFWVFTEKFDYRYTYRYDSAGNEIESVGYDSSGELKWRRTYEIEYR